MLQITHIQRFQLAMLAHCAIQQQCQKNSLYKHKKILVRINCGKIVRYIILQCSIEVFHETDSLYFEYTVVFF